MVQAPLMSSFISQSLRMLAVKHNGTDRPLRGRPDNGTRVQETGSQR
jgi:hypothetical protein